MFFRLFESVLLLLFFFFFNDTATTEIYTLSLHDALPICGASRPGSPAAAPRAACPGRAASDRKSTRLNSSHLGISYAVFCLKKKNNRFKVSLLVTVSVIFYSSVTIIVTVNLIIFFSYFAISVFVNVTATTDIYTLSLHDALPI